MRSKSDPEDDPYFVVRDVGEEVHPRDAGCNDCAKRGHQVPRVIADAQGEQPSLGSHADRERGLRRDESLNDPLPAARWQEDGTNRGRGQCEQRKRVFRENRGKVFGEIGSDRGLFEQARHSGVQKVQQLPELVSRQDRAWQAIRFQSLGEPIRASWLLGRLRRGVAGLVQ